MKKFFTFFLVILTLASVLVACGGETEKKPGGEVTSVSKYATEGSFAEIKDKISWEAINSFPIKKANMDITEARKICVDFFRYAKTARWIPETYYPIYESGEAEPGEAPVRKLEEGVVYGGLPYISFGTGNIYRMMDYMDEEKAVMNMTVAEEKPMLFGNQCANGSYVGFARVINSAVLKATRYNTETNGFLRVGPYTYPDTLQAFSSDNTTKKVIADNGDETMYESYALLKEGDGINYFTSAGHIVMIASDAVVVRSDDGKIDPTQSFVTVIDQTPKFLTATAESGDFYTYQANVDAKWTFEDLKKGNYVPFTFAEWLGTDPIEETEISFSHTGETISESKLLSSKVTSNYYIFDIYAEVYDENGSEVFKVASRTSRDHAKELKFYKAGETIDTWGSLDKLKDGETYTVKVYAQLGTGERPTVWEGTLEH